MSIRTVTVALLAVCGLSGCPGTPQPPTEHRPQPQAAASSARVKTPLDALLKDRDRAKAVQQQVNAHAAAQRQAIEAQSR